MIDTDKYEGHSPQHKWMLRGSGEPDLHQFADGDVMLTSYWLSCPATKANQKLIADAPLILEAYKRLREENKALAEAVKGDNEILKKHIETLAEVKRLRKQLEDCKRQIKETADLIRDRGEGLHATDLDNFLELIE